MIAVFLPFATFLLAGAGAASDQALVVGISDYDKLTTTSQFRDLTAGKANAKLVAQTLQQELGYEEKNVVVLTDGGNGSRPDRKTILAEWKERCQRVSPGEDLFLYFYGHGRVNGGHTEACPVDSGFEAPPSGGIEVDEFLRVAASESKAGRVVIVLDTCRWSNTASPKPLVFPPAPPSATVVFAAVQDGMTYEPGDGSPTLYTTTLCNALSRKLRPGNRDLTFADIAGYLAMSDTDRTLSGLREKAGLSIVQSFDHPMLRNTKVFDSTTDDRTSSSGIYSAKPENQFVVWLPKDKEHPDRVGLLGQSECLRLFARRQYSQCLRLFEKVSTHTEREDDILATLRFLACDYGALQVQLDAQKERRTTVYALLRDLLQWELLGDEGFAETSLPADSIPIAKKLRRLAKGRAAFTTLKAERQDASMLVAWISLFDEYSDLTDPAEAQQIREGLLYLQKVLKEQTDLSSPLAIAKAIQDYDSRSDPNLRKGGMLLILANLLDAVAAGDGPPKCTLAAPLVRKFLQHAPRVAFAPTSMMEDEVDRYLSRLQQPGTRAAELPDDDPLILYIAGAMTRGDDLYRPFKTPQENRYRVPLRPSVMESPDEFMDEATRSLIEAAFLKDPTLRCAAMRVQYLAFADGDYLKALDCCQLARNAGVKHYKIYQAFSAALVESVRTDIFYVTRSGGTKDEPTKIEPWRAPGAPFKGDPEKFLELAQAEVKEGLKSYPDNLLLLITGARAELYANGRRIANERKVLNRIRGVVREAPLDPCPEAEALFEKAHTLIRSRTITATAYFCNNYGPYLIARKNWALLAEAMQDSLVDTPRHGSPHGYYALALSKLGKPEQAAVELAFAKRYGLPQNHPALELDKLGFEELQQVR